MANVVQAVITTGFRRKLARTFARSGPLEDPRKLFTQFKIGEGGSAVVMGNREPVTPLPSRTDLESEGALMAGTVTFTAGSAAVTGAGTSFTTEAPAGSFVKVQGTDVWGEVLSVADNTHLTLAAVWAGATGAATARSASSPWFTFRKTLLVTDVVETAADSGILLVTCVVETGEANDDGFAAAPEFYELGVFDSGGTMVMYETFPVETKVAGRRLKHEVRFTW